MKLLIIEDEKRPREGLYRLIQKEFQGLKLLNPCINGRDGLRTIEIEKPEIIISDIKMPDLNGIDMIKDIASENYSPYIIIISGYSNFDYARESLSLGVKEYILKPFTRSSITSVLSKAIRTVGSSNYLKEILSGRGKYPSAPGYLFLFKYEGRKNYKDLFFYLRTLLLKYSNINYTIDEYCDDNNHLMFFLLSSNRLQEEVPKPNICEINHKIVLSGFERLIGAWIKTTQIPEDIIFVKNILFLHNFYSLPVLIGQEEYCSASSKIIIGQYPYKQEKELITALYKRDIVTAKKLFIQWIGIMTTQEKETITIVEHMEKLIFSIFNTLKEISHMKFHMISSKDYIQSLNECLYKSDIIILFDDIFNLFIIEEMSEHIDNQLIYRAINHIKNHLCETLTLEETADKFQISSEHLSRLFKEETGVGFNQFVNNSKIENAKEKLQKGEMKIYEISDSLSFSSPRYFAKVFKRVTSYTPKEYKEKL